MDPNTQDRMAAADPKKKKTAAGSVPALPGQRLGQRLFSQPMFLWSPDPFGVHTRTSELLTQDFAVRFCREATLCNSRQRSISVACAYLCRSVRQQSHQQQHKGPTRRAIRQHERKAMQEDRLQDRVLEQSQAVVWAPRRVQ